MPTKDKEDWVRPALTQVEKRLQELNSYANPVLAPITGFILSQGGKRLRPRLVLLCSDIYGADPEARADVAAALELIHSASLLHDDVVDNSNLRRGQPSTNQRWGNSTAVLAGDFLFARAYGTLSRYPDILAIVSRAISTMCLGELNQLYTHFDEDTTPEEYVDTIISKTASLIVASCECGAALSPMPEEEKAIISRFALHLGIAFQVIDDLADYVLPENISGKPRGSDIRNGIVTLPLLYLLANPRTRPRVQTLLAEKQPLEPSMLAPELANIGAIGKTGAIACHHLDQGIGLLARLPSRPAVRGLADLAAELKISCQALSNHPPFAQRLGQPAQQPHPGIGPG